MPVVGVRPTIVRAFMLLVAAVELPVAWPPMMHEVSALQLRTVAPVQHFCVCPNAKKPASPSTPLSVWTVYVPPKHYLAASSLAQPYYSARVVSAVRQTTSFWAGTVSLVQSNTMTMQ